MSTKHLSDAEVEAEISRLTQDDDVRLCRLDQNVRYRRRKYLCELQRMKEHGKALRAAGITESVLRGIDEEDGPDA